MKFLLVGLMAVLFSSAARAELNVETMNNATGLAQIMAREAKCGYKIDAKALGDYMKSAKLDAPDVLSWISAQKNYQDTLLSNLSETECAATLATARGIGLTP